MRKLAFRAKFTVTKAIVITAEGRLKSNVVLRNTFILFFVGSSYAVRLCDGREDVRNEDLSWFYGLILSRPRRLWQRLVLRVQLDQSLRSLLHLSVDELDDVAS